MRHLLLVILFLFAQLGALAHGVSHLPDQGQGNEPVCDQCLAYAPLGAAAVSSSLVWLPPAARLAFDAPIPVSFEAVFRAIYQSRAPPLLIK